MPKKTTILLSIGFFIFWLLVLLAGADFPPPPGFIWVILLDLLAALLIYGRAPLYWNWCDSKRRGRKLQVALEGWLVGLLFALLTLLLPGGGEPSVTPGLVDHAIWFGVLGCVGMFNSLGLYGLIVLFHRKKSLRKKLGK